MICPECKEKKMKSQVYHLGSFSTLMAYSPYWDANGIYHDHDPNTTTNRYRCSNGHGWSQEIENVCPGCTWTKKKELKVE